MNGWMIGALAMVAASAGPALAAPGAAALRPGWASFALPGGGELRYLPLAVTLRDYPRQALRADEQGTSLLALQVDVAGRLVECSIVRSSGSALLDAQSCRLYRQRGRFELRGSTLPVTVQAPVRWAIAD